MQTLHLDFLISEHAIGQSESNLEDFRHVAAEYRAAIADGSATLGWDQDTHEPSWLASGL